MRTFTLLTSISILILTNQMFSQANNGFELKQDLLLQERITPHSIPDQQDWNTLEAEIFKDKESRTIVNKTTLQNGFLLMEHTIQNWNDSNWVNDWRYAYTYDGNNKMIEQLRQDWDGSNWINYWRNTYTYDGSNNKIEQLRQDWDGSNWINYWRNTYTYDGSNNMLEELSQEWDGSNWINNWLYTYTYDGNNNKIEQLRQDWDGTNWIICDRSIFSYIPTGVEQLTDGIRVYSLSNNYPNPFNPSTKIKCQIPELSFVTLKIYDVLGSEIATLVNEEKQVGTYEVAWSAENLPSGIYFYRLQAVPTGRQAGEFVQTRKMVLMK